MANWNLPTNSSAFGDVIELLKELSVDSATQFAAEPTNPIDGFIRLVRSPVKFQEWSVSAWSDRVLSVEGGGTGASTPSAARANLELGTMATQDSSAVSITGGSLAGNGSGLTSLDASNLSAGTVPQARKWSEASTSSSGNQDDFEFSSADLLRCDNSSLLTIRGLAAGVPGQRLTIVSLGSGQVDLANQNTNSAAANRIVNGVMGTISLAAGVGRVELQYDGTSERWRVIMHEQGDWIDVPYSAGNFTASGSMTWTVNQSDQRVLKYYLRGRILTVTWDLVETSVGGTVDSVLMIATPGGYTAFNTNSGAENVSMFLINNGTQETGRASASPGTSGIHLRRVPVSNWSASTNNTAVFGQIMLRVQ